MKRQTRRIRITWQDGSYRIMPAHEDTIAVAFPCFTRWDKDERLWLVTDSVSRLAMSSHPNVDTARQIAQGRLLQFMREGMAAAAKKKKEEL